MPHSGSILDSQLSWESGKFQLARWSHEVVIFPERITHPSDHIDFCTLLWVWGVLGMFWGCLKVNYKLSRCCLEDVLNMSGRYLEGVLKVFWRCLEGVWKLSRMPLEGVKRFLSCFQIFLDPKFYRFKFFLIILYFETKSF